MIQYWKSIFQDSWAIYTKNIRLIIGALILMILPNLILLAILPSIESYSGSAMFFIVSILLFAIAILPNTIFLFLIFFKKEKSK